MPATAKAELQRTASAFRFIWTLPRWTALFDPIVEFRPLSVRYLVMDTTGSGENPLEGPEQGKRTTVRHQPHPLRGRPARYAAVVYPDRGRNTGMVTPSVSVSSMARKVTSTG